MKRAPLIFCSVTALALLCVAYTRVQGLAIPGFGATSGYVFKCTNATTGEGHWAAEASARISLLITNITAPSISTVGSEVTVYSNHIPANTISQDGAALDFWTGGTLASQQGGGSDSYLIRIYYDEGNVGEGLFYSSGTFEVLEPFTYPNSANQSTWSVHGRILRKSQTSQSIFVTGGTSMNFQPPNWVAGSADFGNATYIRVTVQITTAGTLDAQGFTGLLMLPP